MQSSRPRGRPGRLPAYSTAYRRPVKFICGIAELRRLEPKASLTCKSVCREKAYGRTPHIRMVPSSDPEASRLPSGEKATVVTRRVCPESVCNSSPSLALRTSINPSDVPSANNWPFGDQAIEVSRSSKSLKAGANILRPGMSSIEYNCSPLLARHNFRTCR